MRSMRFASVLLAAGLFGVLQASTAGAQGGSRSLQALDAQIAFQPPGATPFAPHSTSGGPATTCGDSLRFGIGRATGLQSININNATSAGAAGQWHDAPGPITISGATFYAYLTGATPAPPVQVTVSVFLAGPDRLPTGSALGSTIVSVTNESDGSPTLEELVQQADFASPIAVAAPFVIVVSNPSAQGIGLISSDYAAGDGRGEFLASAQIGNTWYIGSGISIGGIPFDADWLIEPVVSYELAAGFEADPLCLATPGDVAFNNTSSAFAFNRFYNQAVGLGLPQESFAWDYGDGSTPENAVSPTHAYAGTGPYPATLTTTVFGWTAECSATVSRTIQPNAEASFSWVGDGLQVSFTDTSNSGIAWSWDFGDGNTSTQQNPTHAYTSGGDYLVCLQIDNDCSSDQYCEQVSAVQTWTVTPSASAGGSISPDSPQIVVDGATTAFTLAADEGFYLSEVTGDCGGTLVDAVFTTAAVTADCSVEAQFEARVVTSTIISPDANPGRVGQEVLFEVEISGASAPEDGQVLVTASTGENCTDATAPDVVAGVATFSCPITFTTLGPRSVAASFSGSVSHLDSESAPLDLLTARIADLSVAIDDGGSTASAGDSASYLVEVRNAGPDDAPGSQVVLASSPPLEGVSWDCIAVGAATCPPVGSGELFVTVDLPASSGLDFVQSGTVPTPLPDSLTVGVEVGASSDSPDFVFDPQIGNNQASDVNLPRSVFDDGFE